MIDTINTILLWLVTAAMTAAWAWCTKTNLLLSVKFLFGHPVVYRPIPMVGLITGFFALITCPGLAETDELFGFSSGTRRLPLVALVVAPELWAPLGFLGLLIGRRPVRPGQGVPETSLTQSDARPETE